ncbi:MAG TPA: hypothetical protein VG755_21555 [Nannocystaceae bacterium]|nr:hypothetical protein [Nannocystaceae bacterium]
MPRFALVLALGVLALAGGCKKKIGDPCTRSTDCSIRGDRICDLSHRINSQGIPTPGGSGECTIESCGADSCPKEAECVKVYGSDFLTVACDPNREDRAAMGSDPDCLDGICPPRDDCRSNEVCLPEGLCADEITARTSCRKRCKKDNDCRAGYECVSTGARGIYHAPDLDHPGQVDEVRICTPRSL